MGRKHVYPPSVAPGKPVLGQKPKGWSELTFNDVLEVVERPAKLEENKKYQLVLAKRNRGGIVEREILLGKKILTKSQFFLKKEDFLIAKRQIIHGACGVVPLELEDSIVSNEYSVLRVKDGLLLDYLKYYCHSIYFQQTCFRSSVGVDVEKMVFRLPEWLRFKHHFPPLKEQREIVDILSTWDKIIDQIRRLIKAKQKLKKGLMQQLLTGKKRLREFNGKWMDVHLKDICNVIVSNVDKKMHNNEEPVYLCNYLDVYNNHYICKKMSFMESTASNAEITKFQIRKGDVIITKDSETPKDIAKAATVLDSIDNLICGYHLAVLRPFENISGLYLGQALMLPHIRYQFTKAANGATRFGLGISSIEKIKLKIPNSYIEQERISKIVMSCDKEIEILKIKLNLLHLQKKGLLQIMLTGKVRVNV